MRRPVVWLLLMFGITVVRASAEEPAKVPTNLQFLGSAAQSAVQEALEAAPLEGHRCVLLMAAEENRGNWFIEEYLVEALQARGLAVRAGGVASPGTVPADTAEVDTSGGAHSALPTAESNGLADSAGTPVEAPASSASFIPILEYRILDLALHYGGGHRRLLVGSRHVDREALSAVRMRLLDGRTREILWIGSGDARSEDRISGGQLRDVGASAYPCDPPQLTGVGIGKFVEPAVVTAIVAGLVYLFYTNQN